MDTTTNKARVRLSQCSPGYVRVTSEALAQLAQSGQQGFGINTTNLCRVVIFGGGTPITITDTVIGAVGASGESVEQDISVARAAVAGIQLS